MLSLARREFLAGAGGLAALFAMGLLPGREALAAEEEYAFNAPSLREALRALGGIPASGSDVVLTIPDVAENGAVVPVSVECSLPGTTEIFIVVEANPNPLVVRFTIPEGTEPFVSTRIKMAATSNVCAVVRADGRLYSASKSTAVTIGGCG